MDTKASWSPNIENGNRLCDGIKKIIARRYLDQDESKIGQGGKVELWNCSINFLEGVSYSSDKSVATDAKTLIDAINKHESILVVIEKIL